MAKHKIEERTGSIARTTDDQWTWDERRRLLNIGIDVAEKLDELERRVDPHGPPPRHAAIVQQRLRSMMRDRNKLEN